MEGQRFIRTLTALAGAMLVQHPVRADVVDPVTLEPIEEPAGPQTFEKSEPVPEEDAEAAPEAADTRSGFRLGFRSGFGFVTGKVQESATQDMSGLILGQVPLWLDVGGHVSKHWVLSAYFSYGFGVLAPRMVRACDADQQAFPSADISCSSTSVRAGAAVTYHHRPNKPFDPWVGMSVGYEWFTINESADNMGEQATLSGYAHGFEAPTLSLGFDFRLSSLFALGPFLSFAVGRYASAGIECTGACAGFTTQSDDVEETSTHVWIFLGAKGTLTP